MPIPDSQALLLPVLKVLEDGSEHTVEEIRERMKIQFSITPSELAQKKKGHSTIFVNHVAWALANLNMATGPLGHTTAVVLRRKGVYRITEYGAALLRRNPSELTIRDL